MALLAEYNFLRALKLGESYTVDNNKQDTHLAPSGRRVYAQVTNVVYMLNTMVMQDGQKHFVMRLTDKGDLNVTRIRDEEGNVIDDEKLLVSPNAKSLQAANAARKAKIKKEPLNEDENRVLKALRDAGLLPSIATGRTWYGVFVGDVCMGATHSVEHAKQTSKLYRNAKIIELKEQV